MKTKLMKPGEVAAMFAVDEKTVTRWADDGKLGPVVRTIGGHRRFDREHVEKLAAPQEAGA